MQGHRRDPYLWLHFAGLATVPLWLDICLIGLAVGDPIVPPWVELVTLVMVGTAPILWLQWRRPYYVFSLPGLALRPDQLTDDRRRLLAIQRGWLSRALVLLSAIALFLLLYWLYQLAPIAADFPWLVGKSRATGWKVCAIAFFFANFFTLIPATILPLWLMPPRQLDAAPPLPASQILSKFTIIGLRLSKILPDVVQSEATTDSDVDVADEAAFSEGKEVSCHENPPPPERPTDSVLSLATTSEPSLDAVIVENVSPKSKTDENAHIAHGVEHSLTLADAHPSETLP
ncbi:MAG: low-complexity tail membrane protein [Cyanobacteria bacterium P01_C01_bin.120]